MISVLVSEGWRDYELLDSGEGEKLERFGQYIVSRPDPRAIWNKENLELWRKADATYIRLGQKVEDKDEGKWEYKNSPPEPWVVGYNGLKFRLKATSFKHVGVFPEQGSNWEWIISKIKIHNSNLQSNSKLKILNLFGYTGAATLAAASNVSVQVTHVDSSKPAMMWAGENADLSRIGRERIRWIQEDAEKFVKREIRRGVKYDGIIMDPPRFGRGTSGEVWKIEKDLSGLVAESKDILSDNPLFFLINAYTADLSSMAIGNLLQNTFPEKNIEKGELGLKESGERGFVLPAGIYARWSTI